MRSRKLILTALLLAAGIPTLLAAWAWVLPKLSERQVYTDADSIRRPRGAARVRDVLWQPPRPLAEHLDTGPDDYEPQLSADGQTLFFVRGQAGLDADIYAARKTPGGWTAPQALDAVNSRYDDLGPAPSPDGSALYFYSDRPGGQGGYDLWVSRRSDGDWGAPTNLGSHINSRFDDYGPASTPDGYWLYFASNRPQEAERDGAADAAQEASVPQTARRDYDIFAAELRAEQDPEAQVLRLDIVNTPYNEGTPAVSPVGDFLYFASDRQGGAGGYDLYRSRRLDGTHQRPLALGPEINGPADELDPALDLGGFGLYFSSDRGVGRPDGGNFGLYYSMSREVFLDLDTRPVAIDWAALWRRLAPSLMWALAAMLGIMLLLVLMQRARSGHLGLLARCLLASVVAHLLLLLSLSFWEVGSVLAETLRHGREVQVSLASAAGDRLTEQVRAGLGPVELPQAEQPQVVRDRSLPEFPQRAEAVRTTPLETTLPRPERSQLAVAVRDATVPPRTLPDLQRVEPPAPEMPAVALTLPAPRRQRAQEPPARQRPATAQTPRQTLLPPPASPAATQHAVLAPETARTAPQRSVSRLARVLPPGDAPLPESPPAPDTPQLPAAAAQVEPALPRMDGTASASRAEPLLELPRDVQGIRPSRPETPVTARPQATSAQVEVQPVSARDAVVALTASSLADAVEAREVRLPVPTLELPVPTELPPPDRPLEAQLPRLEEAPPPAPAQPEPRSAEMVAALAGAAGVEVRPAEPAREAAVGVRAVDLDPQRTTAAAAPSLATDRAPSETDWRPSSAPPPESRPRLQAVQVALPGMEEQRYVEQPDDGPSMRAESASRVRLGARRAALATGPTEFDSRVSLQPPETPPGPAPSLAAVDAAREATWKPRGAAPARATTQLARAELHLPALEERAARAPGPTQALQPAPVAATVEPIPQPLAPRPAGNPAVEIAPHDPRQPRETSLATLTDHRPELRARLTARRPTNEPLDISPLTAPDLRVPSETVPPNSPYAGRTSDQRLELVERMGGSQDTEAAVARALAWMARHQSRDGRWDSDGFDDGCGECGGTTNIEADIALTGLALLTFLAADHTHFKIGPYQDTVERGLLWLREQQGADGDLRGTETMYSHGIASIALSEALAMTRDERLQDPVQRAVSFIYTARNVEVGGWRYDPGQPGDTSVLGWQVMALKSAERAGVEVPTEAFESGRRWLRRVSRSSKPGLYAYRPGRRHTPAMTAEAMFTLQLLGAERHEPRMRTSAAYLTRSLPQWKAQANTYYWYYGTLAMFQHQGRPWREWNEAMSVELLANQHLDGAAAGSWPPADRWAAVGGRVYQTALCTLMLESYYRYLPMYAVQGE